MPLLNKTHILSHYPTCGQMYQLAWQSISLSTLATNSGYRQIGIKVNDMIKTAFILQHRLYQFIWMSIGFCKPPEKFQRNIDVILSSNKWHLALVYLDDIVAFSKTPDQSFKYVQKVMLLLNSTGTTVKLKKCNTLANTNDYLERVICPRRLELPSYTTNAIPRLRSPTSISELRSILGLFDVLQRFIHNL